MRHNLVIGWLVLLGFLIGTFYFAHAGTNDANRELSSPGKRTATLNVAAPSEKADRTEGGYFLLIKNDGYYYFYKPNSDQNGDKTTELPNIVIVKDDKYPEFPLQ